MIAEYHRVLQEESERVCGRALPPELICLILYKWGGFEHPVATLIRGVTSSVHRVNGICVRIVPYGSIPGSDFGDVPTRQQLENRTVPRAIYVTNHQWLHPRTDPRGRWRFGGTGVCARHLLPDGRIFVWGPIAVHRGSAHDIGDGGMWRGAHPILVRDGMTCSHFTLWALAARCRGMPEHVIGRLCARTVQAAYPARLTKPELCGLLRRAETDYTWRFWRDLFMVYPVPLVSYGAGLAGGVSLSLYATWACAQGMRKMEPRLAYVGSLAAAVLAVRVTGRVVGWALRSVLP